MRLLELFFALIDFYKYLRRLNTAKQFHFLSQIKSDDTSYESSQ